ncbi:MAG: AbfB domain-containing protein, partial [Actinobacteria bacterium]|nr:AbfB domain-containing protein [Actinomycetota bacterium]
PVSFRAINFPTHYVRHRNYLGELTQVTNALDKADASFAVVPGLASSSAVSFESTNFPGYYLRYEGDQIKLQPRSEDLPFRQAATFSLVRGLADGSKVSLQSFNDRTRYLRHRDFSLYLEGAWDSASQRDATFEIVKALTSPPPPPPKLTSLTLTPPSVVLSGPAPSDVGVALSSSHPQAASVPASVVVRAESASAIFFLSTNPVSADVAVTISASLQGITRTAVLSLSAPRPLALFLNPDSVRGGTPVTATLLLTTAAPAGGFQVAMSSSNPSVVAVPSSVAVTAGTSSLNFSLPTNTVPAETTVTVSAAALGVYSQAPEGGSEVASGTTVSVNLRTGPIQ